MILLRKVLFWIFVVLYLTICPLTVLYALGYIVEPGTGQGVVKTGLLHLSTLPSGASVYLENRRYTNKTPTVIRGLLPGRYRLRLTLKNHVPWTRTVHVDAEKATVFDKILLLPNTPAPAVLWPAPLETLLPIPDTPFLLLGAGPTLGDRLVYDWRTAEAWPLISPDSPFQQAVVVWTSTVRGSDFLLVRVRQRDGERFLWIDLRPNEFPPRELTRLFPRPPLWVGWDPREPRRLFAFRDDAINRLDVETMAIYPDVAHGIRGYGIVDRALCILAEDLTLHRLKGEERSLEALGDEPASAHALFGSKSLFRITEFGEDQLFFVGERGELVMSRPLSQLVERGVRGVEFDASHQRLLVWRGDDVGIVETAVTSPVVHWIFQGGRDIEQAFWVYDGSHVLVRGGNRIFLLEREAPEHARPHLLLEVRPRSAVAYVEDAGCLYYLDRETGRFSVVEVVPKKDAARALFPEYPDAGRQAEPSRP